MNTDNSQMDTYLAELRKQVKRIYVQMKAGMPVSDEDKYRSEGFINAGIALGAIDREAALAVLEEVHQSVMGITIAERKARDKTDWNEPMDYSTYDAPTFTRK